MKAIRLTDQAGPNPAYSKAAARDAKAANEPYGVPKIVTHPAGSECDHPMSWIHCCRAEPTMRPGDEECEAKVVKYMNHPARVAQLARLKELAQPVVFKTLPKGLQEYVKQMAAKWLNIDTDEPDEPDENPIDEGTMAFFDSTVDA